MSWWVRAGPVLAGLMLLCPALALPVPPGGGACRAGREGPVVLFEEAHYPVYTVNPQNPSGYASGIQPEGAYAEFAGVLERAGFSVRTNDHPNALASSTLAGVKVLVVACSQGTDKSQTVSFPYAEEELDAIVKFVEDGGGLFLVGDHTVFPPVIYPMAERFGITFGQKKLHDPTDFVPSATPINDSDSFIAFGPDNIQDHPVMRNVTRLELYRTDVFDGLPAEAQPLIISDGDTYTTDTADRPSQAPRMVVAAAVPSGGITGAGRIVAVADTNTFETDEDRDGDGDADLYDSGNDLYGLQAVQWLSETPPHRAVELSSAESATSGEHEWGHDCTAGNSTLFYLKLRNAGNVLDTYDVRLEENSLGYETSLSHPAISLRSAEDRVINLDVRVPAGAPVGSSCRLVLGATSRADGLVTDAVNLTVTVPVLHLLRLSCPDRERTVGAGVEASYDLLLGNLGNIDEVVDIGAGAEPSWPFELDRDQAGLAPGGQVSFRLTVAPPDTASGGETAIVTVTATPRSAPWAGVSVQTRTTLGQLFALELSCPFPVQEAAPGSLVSFPVLVTNLGNGVDDVLLSQSGTARWTASLEPSRFRLAPNASLQAALVAWAPARSPAGEREELTVLAQSAKDPSALDRLVLGAVVGAVSSFRLELSPATLRADPGTSARFELSVTNTGNAPERVLLSAEGPAVLSAPEAPLAVGESALLTVDRPVGPSERAQTALWVAVSGVSALNASVRATAQATVIVNQVRRLGADVEPSRLRLLPGSEANATLRLRNLGNGPDIASVLIEDLPPRWAARAEPPGADLEPQGEARVRIMISVPAGFPAGEHLLRLNITDGAGNGLPVALAVEVLQLHDLSLDVRPERVTCTAGRTARAAVAVSNLGNGNELVVLSAEGKASGWLSFSERSLPLNLSASVEATLSIRPPGDAPPGKYTIRISAAGGENVTRVRELQLVVRERSTSVGDLPCLAGALMFLAAVAAAWAIRHRARKAREEAEQGTPPPRQGEGKDGS